MNMEIQRDTDINTDIDTDVGTNADIDIAAYIYIHM